MKNNNFNVRYQADGSWIVDDLTLQEALMLACKRSKAQEAGGGDSTIDIYEDDKYYLTINTKGE